MAAREEARAVLMVPPRCVQQQLDRGAFTRRVPLAALRIHPRHCQAFMGALADVLLNVPKKRNILQEAGPDGKPRRDSRLLLMCPSVPHMEQLPEDLLAFARAHAAEAATHELVLDYEHWSVEQILRAALPADMREVTSAFESVGHIAHMNLRDEHHPYRQMIGQVILDKNKHIKTVVNKLASIDATFRFFKMEVIAGEDRLEAQVRESGCIFSFDFSKVYWNSRLHTEHERLVRLVRPEDVLCDMTAGVGPFALPAAKKGCRVYANDLNPESFKSLVGNIALNKANGSVHPYNMDARAFPRHMLDLADTDPEQYPPFTHAIINLPASGINFLDTFVGMYHSKHRRQYPLPTIHCHTFSKADDPVADVLATAESIVQGSLSGATVHDVRDVAPKKRMMCISFVLPAAVAYAAPERAGGVGDHEVAAKRAKTSGD